MALDQNEMYDMFIKNGFDIYVYYSDEDINYFLEKIKEKIIEKINEK